MDCLDQDCQTFSFCRDAGAGDLPRPDASLPDAPLPDAPPPDVPAPDTSADLPDPDAPAHDAWVADAAPLDLLAPDMFQPDVAAPDLLGPDKGVSCAGHHDCPQKWFCYLSKCIRDLKMDVYHQGKPGCPPGHWAVDQTGKKSTCAESTA